MDSYRYLLHYALILCAISIFTPTSYAARNEVLGEILLKGASKVEKDSGVWVEWAVRRLSEGAERD